MSSSPYCYCYNNNRTNLVGYPLSVMVRAEIDDDEVCGVVMGIVFLVVVTQGVIDLETQPAARRFQRCVSHVSKKHLHCDLPKTGDRGREGS